MLSNMTTSTPFVVGDRVTVVWAILRDMPIGTGTIERITYQSSDGTPLYWVSGFSCARTADVLRKA